MRRRGAALAAAPLVVLIAAASAAAGDILQLTDGRFVEGVPMRVDADAVVLAYENGEVRVPLALVDDYVIDGKPPPDESGTDETRAERAKGLVPYQGKWITPDRREKLIAQEVARRRAEIEDVKAHQEWRNRYMFETKNFTFESTLPPTLNERFSTQLEMYFTEFKKAWGIKVPKDWGKLKVCFYSSADEFQRTGGVSGGVLAYYRYVAPRELNCYYDRQDPEASVSHMFHEATHYLSDLMDEDFQYPHWIGEAIAEYWGATILDVESGETVVGGIQDGRLVELQNDIAGNQRMSLAELLDSGDDYRHYYWGWSFVHFLQQTPKYEKGFRKYFSDIARAKGVDRVPHPNGFVTVSPQEGRDVLVKYLKVKDVDALQAEWYAYIDGLQTVGTRGLERAGIDAYYRGRRIRAKRLLGEAIAAGSTSVAAHLRYADLLLIEPATRAEAVALNAKACSLDPLNADAVAEWGFALFASGDAEAAKKKIALAREMNPDDPYLAIEISEALARRAREDGK